MDIKNYIRLGKLSIYVRTLIWKYKFAKMQDTLKLMKNKLKEVKKWE